MDITVKTLDGQNKSFSVPDETTVTQFKQQIAGSINISADTQRLIFHGRVLQDDKPLREYDVHGKVIHVVARPPPSSVTGGTNVDGPLPQSGPHHHHHHHMHHMPSNVQSFVVGSFTVPPNLLHSIPVNVDGGSVSVHINLSSLNSPSGNSSGSSQSSQNGDTNLRSNENTTNPAQGQNADGAPTPRAINSNSVSEGTARIAQARRNFVLAENALRRLQNPANRLEGASADSSLGESSPSASEQIPTSQSREATPRDLAHVLREAERLHSTLSPFVHQLCDLAERDPTFEPEDLRRHQLLVDQVSEALHALSHGYHNLSDIAYELNGSPPRRLTAQSLPIYHQPHISQPTMFISGANTNTSALQPQSHQAQAATAINTRSGSDDASGTATTSLSAPSPSAAPNSAAPPSSEQDRAEGAEEGAVGRAVSDPYVFVEVGPDSVTVNSVSTTVVVSEEMDDNDSMDTDTGPDSDEIPAPYTDTTTSTTSTTSAPPSTGSQSTAVQSGAAQPGVTQSVTFPGLASIPGVPSDVMNSIIQQLLQAHGVRHGDQVQVNVVPVQVPSGSMPPNVIGIQSASIGPRPGSYAAAAAASAAPASAAPASSSSSSTSSSSSASDSVSQSAAVTSSNTTSTNQGANPPVTESTSGVTATPLNPNARPGNVFARIPIFRQRTPIAFPPPRALLPMPLMQPTDIYLPCFSHHFISQAVRERLDNPQGGANNAHNLGNMVAGMMSTLFGQPRARGPPVSERSSQQPGGTPQRSANESTSRAQTSTTATQQGSISANPFAALFSQILGGAGPLGQMAAAHAAATAGSHGPGEESGGNGGSSSAVPEGPEAIFNIMFGGGQRGRAGQSGQQQTLASFLQTLGDNHSIVPGEGFLTDAFLCLANQLTFTDMINIFMGQHQPLSRLRRPFRQFVCERVLNGSGITDDNLQRSTDVIVDELLPDLMALVNGTPVHSNISLEATFRKFLSHHLMRFFKLIVDFNVNDEQFGLRFYDDFRQMLGEFVVLMPVCLRDGQQAFINLVRNRLSNMLIQSANPMMQQWMTSVTLQHLMSFQQSVSIMPAQVECHVVRCSSTATETGTASRVAAPSTTTSPPAAVSGSASNRMSTDSRDSPMEVESSPLLSHAASPAAMPVSSSNSVQAPRTLDLPCQSGRGDQQSKLGVEAKIVNGKLSPSTAASPVASSSPSSHHDNWPDVVPADWVPVMEADIQRQKTQRPQAPFSDSYLQGMPPKRRRLMSYEHTGNLSNMADYLPSTVKQAARSAGVEPISSSDNLASEAADAKELQGMLETELTRSLSDRLERDIDYTAERFPNAEQYFKPKPS